MITTNEMIFATLKTKAEKPAKYADQLRELGYEVKTTYKTYYCNAEFESDYWTVNNLHVVKYEGETAYLGLRSQHINKFENMKRVDFVNYFATLDERKAKEELMDAHDSIEQVRRYEVYKDDRYMDESGRIHRWRSDCSNYYTAKRVQVRRRYRRYTDENHVIAEYKQLKRKADARSYWNGAVDSEIRDAELAVKRAELKIENLWKELERAEQEVQRRREDVQKKIGLKQASQAELNAWLVAKGIR